jgi:hypothetical protein
MLTFSNSKQSHACPLCAPSVGIVSYPFVRVCASQTYQCLHGTVKSVSVVATELGVDTLEGWVTVGLGLLDTVDKSISGCEESSRWLKSDEPVTVSLLALVVLGRVLRL